MSHLTFWLTNFTLFESKGNMQSGIALVTGIGEGAQIVHKLIVHWISEIVNQILLAVLSLQHDTIERKVTFASMQKKKLPGDARVQGPITIQQPIGFNKIEVNFETFFATLCIVEICVQINRIENVQLTQKKASAILIAALLIFIF